MATESRSESLNAAREAYERWLHTVHTGAHSRRTAERNAAFFLPRLRRGMRLIDIGCGPGSITIGLAAAVAPGEVVGIDIAEQSLAMARSAAAERDVANVSFERADANDLPFPDDSFDAGFAHYMLQHLPDPLGALTELYRVVRPGGVVGVADADFDGALTWPDEPMIERSTEIRAAIRGGSADARIGKRLRALLHEAGFRDVVATATGGSEGDAATTARNGAHWAEYYRAEPFVAYAEAVGVATREEMLACSAAWERWAAHPGAFVARWGCSAVGWK